MIKKPQPDYFGHFGFENPKLMPKVANLAWELNADRYSNKVQFSEFAIKSYEGSSFGYDHETALRTELKNNLAKAKKIPPPTLADTITLFSLGLGLWWAAGGPVWAGLLSILGDEVDGRIARATKTTSERGSALDWGSDIILTAAALMRLGVNTGHLTASIIAAPIFLFGQAQLRSQDWRPPVGSARAVVMLSAMVVGKRV